MCNITRCVVPFSGHKNVRATHRTTIEITTHESLTPRGDCIVGVASDVGCFGLPYNIRRALQSDSSKVRILFTVGDDLFAVYGRGSSELTLTHPQDIVLRKSDFVCPRTLVIGCDAASIDMPRHMVQSLQGGVGGTMEIVVQSA